MQFFYELRSLKWGDIFDVPEEERKRVIMAFACCICVCLTVIACCGMSLYTQCRESDFEDIRQDLALLRSDHEKLKKELDDFESEFEDEE